MTAMLVVDLAAPPEERFRLGAIEAENARRLLDVYLRDLGANDEFLGLLAATAPSVVPPAYMAEMSGLAARLGVPLTHVLAGNLYYDALKLLWGCTAFALDGERGPLHARNLDWSTENRVLNDTTCVIASSASASSSRSAAPSRSRRASTTYRTRPSA
jgi:acid ceramidase